MSHKTVRVCILYSIQVVVICIHEEPRECYIV